MLGRPRFLFRVQRKTPLVPSTPNLVADSSASPEFELLLACTRVACGTLPSGTLRTLALESLEWEKFLALAKQHALRPLVQRQLEEHCGEMVPQLIRERLKQDVLANARHNLQLTRELLRVLACLREREIRVLPYKGPVLSTTAYGNLAIREFLDLDILVPPAQVPTAKAALVAAGYQPTPQLTVRQEAALLHSNCEYALYHAQQQSCVELHWRIAPSQFAIEFDIEQLWTRSRKIRLGGVEVRTLADEDLLIILSVHGAKHLWQLLCWLVDLAALLRARPDLDWTRALADAGRVNASRILLISLQLCHELLGTDLPPQVTEEMNADREVAAVARVVVAGLRADHNVRASSVRMHRLFLRTRSRWRDKARYASRVLFTPGVTEWSLLALPAPLAILYPFMRLGRLAGKLLKGPAPPISTPPALGPTSPPARS